MPRKSKKDSDTEEDVAADQASSSDAVSAEETDKEYTLEDLPGIGPAIARKLQDATYHSVESIAVANVGDLAAAAEIGETTAQKIVAAARKLMKMASGR